MRAAVTISLLAVLVAGYHGQQKHSQATNVQNAGEQAPPKAISPVADSASKEKKPSPYEKTKTYLWKATRPEFFATWVLVIAAGIGLYVTWRTARAALLNAQAVIDSERAVILGDQIGKLPEVSDEPNRVAVLWVNVPMKNFGRTVGRLYETSQQGILIPKGKALPPEPEFKSRFQWTEDPLPPNITAVLQVGIAEQDFLTAKNGANTLYIYGFVKYSDLGNVERETRFCYVYHLQSGYNPSPTGFYPCANCPKSYTRYT